MFLPKNRALVVVSLFLVIVTTIAIYFWNEARKEIVYLCGNFREGVSQSSVLKQLNTAKLSSYKVIEMSTGRRIEFDSILNFDMYKCVIEVNPDGRVEEAEIE